MQNKTISNQQFNELPRDVRREFSRQAKKEGRVLPDKLPEKTKVIAVMDRNLWHKGLKVLEDSNISVERFLNLSFKELINAKSKI